MTSKYYLPFLDINLLIFFYKNFTNLETDLNFEFIHLALKQSFYLLRLTLISTASLSHRIKVSYFILFRFILNLKYFYYKMVSRIFSFIIKKFFTVLFKRCRDIYEWSQQTVSKQILISC